MYALVSAVLSVLRVQRGSMSGQHFSSSLLRLRAKHRVVLGSRRSVVVRAERDFAKDVGGTTVTKEMLSTERYIATNRFKVKPSAGAKFEQRWATRKSRLAELDGFRYFHLMRRVPRRDGEEIPAGAVHAPLAAKAALVRPQLAAKQYALSTRA